jgi:hypothetical protein
MAREVHEPEGFVRRYRKRLAKYRKIELAAFIRAADQLADYWPKSAQHPNHPFLERLKRD